MHAHAHAPTSPPPGHQRLTSASPLVSAAHAGRNSRTLGKPVQARLLWRVLQLSDKEDRPVATLADVHARYWGAETRLTLYCELLDAVPAAARRSPLSP